MSGSSGDGYLKGDIMPFQRKRHMNLIQGSVAYLACKSYTFDRVWFTEVLEHLKMPTKVLSDIRITLRLGGLLMLSTLYPSILGRHIHSRDATRQKLFTVEELLELLHLDQFQGYLYNVDILST
jgi:2-polyprenyl-3-methyl-5-hydroxy-6-metoxy-1,4-benzoquinol methylase